MASQTILLDIDVLLPDGKRWRDRPRRGTEEFLASLARKYRVIVYADYSERTVWDWLKRYYLVEYIANVFRRPSGTILLGRTAINFKGSYKVAMNAIERQERKQPGD